MNLVFCGMKHCGKSKQGKLTATHFGIDFIDSDELIEASYQEKCGAVLNTRQIFQKEGKEFFRNLEAEVIRKFIASPSKRQKRQVIALGGGVPSNPLLGKELKELGFFIFLRVPQEIIFKRIEANGLPQFLQTAEPYTTFLELYQRRLPFYLELADLVIDLNNDFSPLKNNEIILTRLKDVLDEW